MGNPSIRGHQTVIKLLKAGQPTNIVNITSFDCNQDANFSKSKYVGQKLPEGDVSYEGWSGSFETEVKDAAVDEMIDAMVTNNLDGVGADEINIVDTEFYVDGSSKSYVYFDVQCKMGKSARGMSEKVTKKIDFQASGRLAL